MKCAECKNEIKHLTGFTEDELNKNDMDAVCEKCSSNPSLFPISLPDGSQCFGASLRDHFAGLALNGIFANSNQNTIDGFMTSAKCQNLTLPQLAAKTSYEFADAMLRERLK